MKKRRIISLFAAFLVAGSLASCGNGGDSGQSSTPAENSTSTAEGTESSSSETATYTPNFDEDPYEVHFQYIVAAEGADQQMVADAISDLALSEMNMTVDLIPQTMGTWSTNMSMILAANEPLDLFNVGSSSFGTYIESGYVRNFADYLDYVPDVVETLGDDIKAGYVGDFLVGFGKMKERGYWPGLVVRQDVMDAIGVDASSIEVNTEDTSSYEQITDLYAKVKEAYPDMTCLGGYISLAGTMCGGFADGLGNNFGMLDHFGQDTTVTNWFESDLCRDLCQLQREWFTAGYESADIATSQDAGETLMKAGNLFSFMCYIKPNTAAEKKSQTGYDVSVIPLAEKTFTSSSSVNSDVYALANASEDPVKAAAFYNWAFTSEAFNDLVNWGVEGVHWVEDEDGLATYPDGVDATTVGYHQDFGFTYPNQFAGHPWAGNPVDIWDQYEEYNASLARSAAFGFTFDPSSVNNEIAACTSAFDQYDNDVFTGAIDTDEGLAAMNEALYGAGLQTIMDEKQSQLDAWMAEQGN